MSNSSTTPEDCAMCEKKGDLQCAGCRSVRFCSKNCQTLFWPVHKYLCKFKDDPTFRAPPLTPFERDLAEKCIDEQCTNRDLEMRNMQTFTLFDLVKHLGLFRPHGYRYEFLDRISKGGDLLDEPYLTSCLLLVRCQIIQLNGLGEDKSPFICENDTQQIWTMMAGAVGEVVSCLPASRHFGNEETHTFRQLSTYFRVLLAYAALLTINMKRPFTVRSRAIEAVVLRIPSTFDRTKLQPEVLYCVDQFIQTATWSYGPNGQALGRAFLRKD